jgi:integrase
MARKSSNGRKPAAKRPIMVRIIKPRVWKNGDGSESKAFRFRYPNPQKPGKYIIRQFTNMAELHKERIRIEGELAQNIHIPLGDNPTLAEWAWRYYDNKKKAGLAAGSLTLMEINLRLHILGGGRETRPGQYLYLGNYKLAELTPSIIDDWKDAILGEPPPEHLIIRASAYRGGYREKIAKPRSRKKVLVALIYLREMLDEALHLELPGVNRNVAKKIKVEDARSERESDLYEEDVDYPTPDEMKQILRYARDEMSRCNSGRWFPFFATYIFTGARSGEIKALRWDRDVHFDTGWIDIRFAFDQYRNLGPTKTRAGRRKVPLFEPLTGILREWMLECPREGVRLQTSEGKARRVAQFLMLNPKVGYKRIGKLFNLDVRSVKTIRELIGLPKYRGRPKCPPLVWATEDDPVPICLEPRRLGLVFPTRYGQHNLTQGNIGRRLRSIQRRIGMIKRDAQGQPILAEDGRPQAKYSPHDLRHFYVSYCAHLGFSLEEVAQFVGHSAASMTRHYRHLFRDAEKEARDRAKLTAGFQLLLPGPDEEISTKVINFRTKDRISI